MTDSLPKSPKNTITASILYDLVQCPRRVTMDLFGNPKYRDPVNPFVELLWERGHTFEKEVIDGLRVPFLDLKDLSGEEKDRMTLSAMQRGESLIYGGRIQRDNLLGEPDLLRRCSNGYVAGDIKSGAGVEGETEDSDGKPKKHYAVQLALYTDILEQLGVSGGRTPFVWDIHGREVLYSLNAPIGSRNKTPLWDIYQKTLATALRIMAESEDTLAANAETCKLCHWHSACLKQLEEIDDLTLIPELGRSRRDILVSQIKSVEFLAKTDIGKFIRGRRTVFRGIGIDTLQQFQERARLQKQPHAKPYLKEKIDLPEQRRKELFFDVETDPMRDICYLHGFIERSNGKDKTERYVTFLAEGPNPEQEEKAFADAWAYIRQSRPCLIFYYSAYERTIWRKLQEKYPEVASKFDVEDLFNPGTAIDLYNHIVRSKSEWPTRDYSIKTLACFLGFKWRDPSPSGAASVEWYHRWVESKDPKIRQHILDYNEDDCRAMRVLWDAIKKLKKGESLLSSKQKNDISLVGVSSYTKKLHSKIKEAAKNVDTVLIVGPTGTGKEIIAQCIHNESKRRDRPFISINCASIPESLFESNLFGVIKGYATDVLPRKGCVATAEGGTLFLDEIGTLTLSNQQRFLRFLQDKTYSPCGSDQEADVKVADVRIIAATNKNLKHEIQVGTFQDDLFFRINDFVITTDWLYKHPDDLICLVNHYDHLINLDPRSKFLLYVYHFPGNVRELMSLVKKDPAEIMDNMLDPQDMLKNDPEFEEEQSVRSSRLLRARNVAEDGLTVMDWKNHDVDRAEDRYLEEFGTLSKHKFTDLDRKALTVLTADSDTRTVKRYLKLYGSSDAKTLAGRLLRKRNLAIEKRDRDIIEKRLRLYEVIILAERSKCSKHEIVNILHIRDEELSTKTFKETYHFPYPDKHIEYDVETPFDVFPEPKYDELDDDDD